MKSFNAMPAAYKSGPESQKRSTPERPKSRDEHVAQVLAERAKQLSAFTSAMRKLNEEERIHADTAQSSGKWTKKPDGQRALKEQFRDALAATEAWIQHLNNEDILLQEYGIAPESKSRYENAQLHETAMKAKELITNKLHAAAIRDSLHPVDQPAQEAKPFVPRSIHKDVFDNEVSYKGAHEIDNAAMQARLNESLGVTEVEEDVDFDETIEKNRSVIAQYERELINLESENVIAEALANGIIKKNELSGELEFTKRAPRLFGTRDKVLANDLRKHHQLTELLFQANLRLAETQQAQKDEELAYARETMPPPPAPRAAEQPTFRDPRKTQTELVARMAEIKENPILAKGLADGSLLQTSEGKLEIGPVKGFFGPAKKKALENLGGLIGEYNALVDKNASGDFAEEEPELPSENIIPDISPEKSPQTRLESKAKPEHPKVREIKELLAHAKEELKKLEEHPDLKSGLTSGLLKRNERTGHLEFAPRKGLLGKIGGLFRERNARLEDYMAIYNQYVDDEANYTIKLDEAEDLYGGSNGSRQPSRALKERQERDLRSKGLRTEHSIKVTKDF